MGATGVCLFSPGALVSELSIVLKHERPLFSQAFAGVICAFAFLVDCLFP